MLNYRSLRFGELAFFAGCRLFSSTEGGPIDRIHCGLAWLAPNARARFSLKTEEGDRVARIILPKPLVGVGSVVLMGDASGPVEFDLDPDFAP